MLTICPEEEEDGILQRAEFHQWKVTYVLERIPSVLNGIAALLKGNNYMRTFQ
jgi:hypothetical protein